MDVRVKDWATESRDLPLGRTYQSLRASIIRFLIVFSIVWVCLYALQYLFPYVQNGAAAVKNVKYAAAQKAGLFSPDAKFRYFAFGNSKSLAGFEPESFDRALGGEVTAYNLAIPGDSKFVDLLDSALKAGNVPSHVLLQLLPEADPHESSFWALLQDNKKIANILFPFRNFVRDAVVFAFESRGRGVVAQYRSNADQIRQLGEDRGYFFIKSQSHFPGDRLPDGYALPTDRPNEIMKRPFNPSDPDFLRLMRLAEQYGFQVFVAPAAFRQGEYAPPPPVDQALTDALRPFPNAHVLGPAYWLYEPKEFSDPVHLNPAGAQKYTSGLADLVGRAAMGEH
ncbi:hypothetical protein [Methylocella sp.]|uniref:hypothetical protein n=1 Tax=Methylocella sp. TaxID=1978226 RepID=UPI003783A997